MDALTRRARIAARDDDPEVRWRALCGLFNFHLIRSDLRRASRWPSQCSNAARQPGAT
jgi:hypothetical protein